MSWALKGLCGLGIFSLRMEMQQDRGLDHKAWSQGQEPEQVHKEVHDVTHKNWSCFCVFHYPNKGRSERHWSLNMPLNMKVQGKRNCPFSDYAPHVFEVNRTTANAQNWFLSTTYLLTRLLPNALCNAVLPGQPRLTGICQRQHSDLPLEIQIMIY